MEKKDCPFCVELRNPKESVVGKSRIVGQTSSFVVFPTTGGFVSNYQLIVPKKHINCFGELTDAQYSELEKIVSWQEKINNDYFNSKSAFFEHGALFPHNESGKSIVHAHLHSFPHNSSLLRDIEKYKFDVLPINDISDLRNVCKEHDTYLYYRDIDGSNYIITHQGLPSQFLRKVLAESLDMLNWNWRDSPMLDKIEESIQFYKNNPQVFDGHVEEENDDYFAK